MLFGTGVFATSAQMPMVRASHIAKPNVHGEEKYTLPTLVGGNSASHSQGHGYKIGNNGLITTNTN